MNNEYIDLSNQREYDAEGFRDAIRDVLRLIRDILLLSKGCDIDGHEIAVKTYVLDWLLCGVELRHEKTTLH